MTRYESAKEIYAKYGIDTDAAIAKCKSIQTQCVQKDNGLASRMMNVFAGIRQNAELQVQRDEQHLYDLRTEMEMYVSILGQCLISVR